MDLYLALLILFSSFIAILIYRFLWSCTKFKVDKDVIGDMEKKVKHKKNEKIEKMKKDEGEVKSSKIEFPDDEIQILYGTQKGMSKKFSEELPSILSKAGFNVFNSENFLLILM